MALRQTLARASSKHSSAYGTPLDRFLGRYPSSSTVSAASSSSSSIPVEASVESLFKPAKNEQTGKWAPPRYSLRRQAILAKEAQQSGLLESLPKGLKTAKIQSRLDKLQQYQEFEEASSQFAYAPQDPTASQQPLSSGLKKKTLKPTQRIPEQDQEKALRIAKGLIKTVGPYAGRSKVFKGSAIDRESIRRRQDVENKLAAMNDTVKDWEAGQRDAKNKLKPGLPF